MKRRTENILITASVIIIALAIAAIAYASVVLFAGSPTTVPDRLTVGSLDVGFYRTSLFGEDGDGEFSDGTRIDLRGGGEEIFRIKNFCPTMWQTATFEAVNSGKTAAELFVSVRPDTANVTSPLVGQMLITVSSGETERIFSLASPPDRVDIGRADVGKTVTFSVRAELPDRTDNNAAMGLFLSVDVELTAVQC